MQDSRIEDLSDSDLQRLHTAVRKAFVRGELETAGVRQYGIRDFGPVHNWIEAVERELDRRGMDYRPIAERRPRTPPAGRMRYRSCSPPTAWIAAPAPRKSRALKRAWVARCKIAAGRRPPLPGPPGGLHQGAAGGQQQGHRA